jgi:cupin 2 domain-containing protein
MTEVCVLIVKNVFSGIPGSLRQEFVEILVRSDAGRVERIVSRGHSSPPGFWYDQAENECVVLLSGEAKLRIEGEPDTVILRAGDWLDIPGGTRHRVEWTAPNEDTVWLAVFY